VNINGKACLSDDGWKQIAYNTFTHISADVRFHDLDTAATDLQFLYLTLLYTAQAQNSAYCADPQRQVPHTHRYH
jgi:hypothetical protein